MDYLFKYIFFSLTQAPSLKSRSKPSSSTSGFGTDLWLWPLSRPSQEEKWLVYKSHQVTALDLWRNNTLWWFIPDNGCQIYGSEGNSHDSSVYSDEARNSQAQPRKGIQIYISKAFYSEYIQYTLIQDFLIMLHVGADGIWTGLLFQFKNGTLIVRFRTFLIGWATFQVYQYFLSRGTSVLATVWNSYYCGVIRRNGK